jgi:hypothetical protein
MPTNIAKLKLRAFKISNPNITEANSGILPLLLQVLTESSTAQQRRMKLNKDDVDEDLLSDFSWQRNNSYLFGVMLRIIPAETGGVIDDSMFEQNKITIAEVTTGDAGKSQYKDHYYFVMNNNYIVTNLPGTYSIDRFQTYINFLLDGIRSSLFEFVPLTKLPNDNVKISDIKSIEFTGGKTSVSADVDNDNAAPFKMLSDLTSSLFKHILSDTTSWDEIKCNQIISAKLLLTVKSKPRDMKDADYQRVMGAALRQITDDNGVVIHTKNGRYTGKDVKVVKDITVERTSNNRIVEEQLKQKMESFLDELTSKGNNG